MIRGPGESEIQIRMSHCRYDLVDEDMHVCQMQVGVGMPVTRTEYIGSANCETSDEYRRLVVEARTQPTCSARAEHVIHRYAHGATRSGHM